MYFFGLIFIFTNFNFVVGDPIMQLPSGLIHGREITTIQGKPFFVFEKIPYATPLFRFKEALPVKPWNGILNTTYLDVVCYQLSISKYHESEDCLYINVYTPRFLKENENINSSILPIMLFIHGGGFVDGSSIGLSPDHFIDNDVILVTFNYRLGLFGFLSTEDSIIPGNNGLKDQHLAIQWTHNNIHLFGGDPEKITIFGHSAGSASVTYHLLNKKSQGLFRGVICQSGSFLNNWAFQRNAREAAFTIAGFLNKTFNNISDSTQLLKFLQSVSVENLDKASKFYYNYIFKNNSDDLAVLEGFSWAPVIEVHHKNAFLEEKMYSSLHNGNFIKVPIIVGITSEESLSFHSNLCFLRKVLKTYDENLDWLVPNSMKIKNIDNRREMGRLIREIYTKGKLLSDNLGDGIRFSSDNSYTRSIIKFAEIASKFSKTYFYQFSYDGMLGNGNFCINGAEKVGHGEELNYIFWNNATNYSGIDQIIQKRIINLWTNFAKYLDPIPEPSELLQNITWPLVSSASADFFYIDVNKNLTIRNYPKKESYSKWNKLFESLENIEFDTY